jgi:hypothetical protein
LCNKVQPRWEKDLRTLVLNESMWLNVKMTGYRTRTASQPRHRHQDVPSTTRLPSVPATTVLPKNQVSNLFGILMSPPVSRNLAAGVKLTGGTEYPVFGSDLDNGLLWLVSPSPRLYQYSSLLASYLDGDEQILRQAGLASLAFAVLQHKQVRILCL